jgi:hypothetical protein
VLNFFLAVRNRWPRSWDDLVTKGNVLPKTNGLKALMRYLKIVYLKIAGENREYIPTKEEFARFLAEVPLSDENFNIQTFPPGTSGESRLFNLLKQSLDEQDPDQQDLI